MADESFPDYYALIGVTPKADRDEIGRRVRAMTKEWHPDVCRRPEAHEMMCSINEAKHVLLDPAARRLYDEQRRRSSYGPSSPIHRTGNNQKKDAPRRTGQSTAPRTGNSPPSSPSSSDAEWARARNAARSKANADAGKPLEDLLWGLAGTLAVGATLAAEAASMGVTLALYGTDRVLDRKSRVPFATLCNAGLAGWACVVCLIVPGVSIITFYCFYKAFFPAPTHKFIGLDNVLRGMFYVSLIVFAFMCVCLLLSR